MKKYWLLVIIGWDGYGGDDVPFTSFQLMCVCIYIYMVYLQIWIQHDVLECIFFKEIHNFILEIFYMYTILNI